MSGSGNDNDRQAGSQAPSGQPVPKKAHAGDSIHRLRAELESNPDDLHQLASLAELESRCGEQDQAARHWMRAIRLAPDDPGLHCGLGRAALRAGRPDDAMRAFRSALAANPGHAPAYSGIGEVLGRQSRLGEAEQAFRKALDCDAGCVDALFNLAQVRLAAGDVAEARRLLMRLVEIEPAHSGANARLGDLAWRDADYPGALARFARVCERRPRDPDARVRLGTAHQMLGGLDDAEACYRRALALAPGHADAMSNLGTVYQARRDPERAMEHYRRALEMAPGHADALAGAAAIHDWRGEYRQALDLIGKQSGKPGESVELAIIRARLLHRVGESEAAGEALQQRLNRGGDGRNDRQRMHFVLGEILDGQGQFDRAFEHFRQGNALKDVVFDVQAFEALCSTLQRTFSRDTLDQLGGAGSDDPRPVFIVGLPRSGTSLAEQILASHPAVRAFGERAAMQTLVREFAGRVSPATPYPDCVALADAGLFRSLAAEYLAQYRDLPDEVQRVTDKLTGNFMHIGLIEVLFPRARIVHCVRDPLDALLSCYFTNFAGANLPFAYDFRHLAAYFHGYRQLMAHWQSVSRLPVFQLNYETLVDDQETSSRDLVDFLGLDWDPGCLDFHRQQRVTLTASHAQVRKPLYRRSVARHRNYEAHIRPLREALGGAHR